MPDLNDIEEAFNRIKNLINKTEVMTSRTMNNTIDAEVFFKCENFQRVGAFKFRGVSNKLLQLNKSERTNGVVTHSSGNHAQAVALASSILGIKAVIVMPENAPKVKVDATRADNSVIIGKDDSGSNREWLISIPTNLSVFRLHLWNSSGTLSYFDTSSFSLGDWHFVCMTWDGSTLQGYLDGVADGSTSITSARTTNTGLVVGELSNNRLDGLLQNIRVYNRALSASEVALLYERPFEGLTYGDAFHYDPPTPANLTPLDNSSGINTDCVGWWPLTETDDYASGAADISGNGYDGTKSGTVTSEPSILGTVGEFDGSTGYIRY